jgi:hypothetical protein
MNKSPCTWTTVFQTSMIITTVWKGNLGWRLLSHAILGPPWLSGPISWSITSNFSFYKEFPWNQVSGNLILLVRTVGSLDTELNKTIRIGIGEKLPTNSYNI